MAVRRHERPLRWSVHILFRAVCILVWPSASRTVRRDPESGKADEPIGAVSSAEFGPSHRTLVPACVCINPFPTPDNGI